MFHKLKSQRTLISSTLNLDILNKNILYLTHEVDKCVSMLRRMELDSHLQKQVDDFYPSPPSTQSEVTSPQTDAENTTGSPDDNLN